MRTQLDGNRLRAPALKQHMQTHLTFSSRAKSLFTEFAIATAVTTLLLSAPTDLLAASKKKANANKSPTEISETTNTITREGEITFDGCTYHISLEATKGTSEVTASRNTVGDSRSDEHCFVDDNTLLSMPKAFKGEFKIIDVKLGNPSAFFVGTYRGDYAFILRESFVGNTKMYPIITQISSDKVETIKVRQDKKKRWIIEGFDGDKRVGVLIVTEKGETLKDDWDID